MSIIQNAIQVIATEEILISKHRHDYVTSSSGEYFIDGGLEYCRSSHLPSDKILWLGLSTESSLFDISEKLVSFRHNKLIKDLTEEEVFTLGAFLQRVASSGYYYLSLQEYALSKNQYWPIFCESIREGKEAVELSSLKSKVTLSVNSHLIKKSSGNPEVPVIRVDLPSGIVYTNKVKFASGTLEHCSNTLKCGARVYITTTLDKLKIENPQKYNPLWLQQKPKL